MEVDEPLTHKQRTRALQTESLPWVEKYRPKEMHELVSHEDIINTITRLIDAGKLPHLLLYGPAGTGKTSTILACAHRMYGKHFNSMVLELNASDDRGIDVVRDQIKEFASTRQMFSNIPKLVILDEADNMTNAAQALERLKIIADKEECNIQEGGLDACVTLGLGDMRRSINILQSVHMGFGKVDPISVYQCTGAPMPMDIQQARQTEWNRYLPRCSPEDDCSLIMSTHAALMHEKGLALIDIVTELHK
ncbi:MAG: hypothetical protein SGPRY_007524 [Prymnesium sp.]